jgi:FlaA1/EpsC-like NDP-sugar epimerase
MGTSKRLAEMILQAINSAEAHTKFSMVRFGNVLGSSGSVVPLFREQIKKGGPITITDPEITRYFMTIEEASQLVIQAGAMASGGEVFVLDMGEPVRIIDLAKRMIELSGLQIKDKDNPDGDIEIRTVGLRPGEKLYEELLIGDNPEPTSHVRIMKANERYMAWDALEPLLATLKTHLEDRNVQALRDRLRMLVPEFTPDDALVDWVHLEQNGS